MKNVLQKYLKRIIFYLIPLFFFTNQKYTTCNDISVLSEYNSIDEKLDDICKNNKNLCIMIDAIKHSFNALNTFSQSVKTENKKYLISYDNVNSNNINCQDISVNIEAKSDNEKYTISLSTCTSILEGNLKINTEKFQNSTKLHFEKIIIFANKTSIIGDMHVSILYNDKKFDYVKIFDDELFTNGMNIIMENVFNNYTNQLRSIIELNEYQLLSQIKYFGDVINKFAREYSFINQKIKNNETKITYIAYNEFGYETLINIYDHMYIPNLTVHFEYALNYNITYHEGNFTLDYMNFSKSKNDVFIGNFINKFSEFEKIIPNSDSICIWNTIKKDFGEKFKEYK